MYGFKTLSLSYARDPAVVLAAALNTAKEAITRLTAQPINGYAQWPLLSPDKTGTPSYSANEGEQFGGNSQICTCMSSSDTPFAVNAE